MLHIVIGLLYPLFLASWRRCFGSNGWDLPILKYRAVQHIIGGVVAFGVCLVLGYTWWQSLAFAGVLQGLYFSLGHGAAYDMSRGGNKPDEKTIKRYKQFFWNKWCEFLVPKDSWYGFGYDFLWMLFRYGLPALLMSVIILKPSVAMCGLSTALCYAVCWSLYDKGKLKYLYSTELAEILMGFFTGLLIVL